MSLIAGLYVWKTRSTPSPWEILRTVKEEFRPRLLLAMTTPSYACTRSRSPSTTFTCTTTVSPGLNSGTARVMRCFSISWMILLMFVHLDPESHSAGAAPRPTAARSAADRGGAAPFAPAPVADASDGCQRDHLTIAPPAPRRPRTPPGACSAASRAAPA